MSLFTNKTLLITGGTGSFGNAVLKRFLNTDIKEIRIFSRDEKKQDDMMLMFYQLNLFHSTWLVIPIALIIGIGILNAFNFMDGINGITGAYSFVVLAGLWYVNRSVNFVHPDFIIYILLGLAVFNIFNFRKKAKCFAGDVGAISIAFIVVFLLGSLILKTGNYSYILMLVVYGVDTILTIIHRIMVYPEFDQLLYFHQ